MPKRWLDHVVRQLGLAVAEQQQLHEARVAASEARLRLELTRKRGNEVHEVSEQLRDEQDRNGFAALLARSMIRRKD